MPNTIIVQIPLGYKGKVTIDVSDVEPIEEVQAKVDVDVDTEVDTKPKPKSKPKSKKLPRNWDRNMKPRGCDGRYVKDTFNDKKIKLECQLKHAETLP